MLNSVGQPTIAMTPFVSVPGQLSLVIAVTGHRDLDPAYTDWYRERIGQIFVDLRRRLPDTPLLLLSALAEGADRIAVHAALDHGVPYVAVLPMPEELYRRDFLTDASNADFVELLSRAVRCLTIPLTGETDRHGESAEPARDAQYQALGRFFVRHSQILIAVWDRERIERKPGGTADVVMMKLRMGESAPRRLAVSPMNIDGSGPVYILAGHRLGAKHGGTPALACAVEYPDGVEPGVFESSYKLLNRFNSDVRGLGAPPEAPEVTGRDLMEGQEPVDLSDAMRWVAAVYSRADRLAIHFNRQSLTLLQLVFVLIAVGGASIGLHHSGGGTPSVVLSLYYGSYATAIALIAWQHFTGQRSRHEDYRSLAEALRVQFFWMAAGLRDLAADQYLRRQADEMIWIRDALRECALFPDTFGLAPPKASQPAGGFDVAREWIKGQKNYFGKRARTLESKRKSFRLFAVTVSVIGFIAPLAGLLASHDERIFRTTGVISVWLAGVAWDYIERRGFMQEARQYTRMFALFSDAERDLGRFVENRNLASSEEIIRQLGSEALAENGDWLAMHRDRKLSVDIAIG